MSEAEVLPFVDEARAGLVRHFGLTEFRPGQAEVVSAVLARRNAVVVMPTGAGKSLCFQLPALLLEGVTLVVSPLIALMKDQVEQLTARGLPATFLNSTLSESERNDRLRRLREREYRLLYVSPERLRSEPFLQLLKNVGVELMAVDEAHCISQWGHDFRPDYARLGRVRKFLRPPRTVALTATATPEVRNDIVASLLMKDPQVFVAGFDRPNLSLECLPVSGDEDKRQVCAARAKEGGSGIIYCSTRKAAEDLHRSMKGLGGRVVLYHAGLDDAARHRAQDAFMAHPEAVVVATNAFGMGIDKPNVRFVIHAAIPRAVEAYYQEIGRAGRDGEPAEATLLFNHADVFTQERLIQGNFPPDVVLADLWRQLLKHPHGFDKGQHVLAGLIGASDFEVSAALRVLERAGLLDRESRQEGAYQLQLSPGAASELLPDSADPLTRRLLGLLVTSFPASRTISTEVSTLALRLGAEEEEVRRALKQLERQALVSVSRPFSGRVLRPLSSAEFRDLPLDLRPLREQQRRTLLMLRRMTDYAYAQRCRRAFILRYFGEQPELESCGRCDVCRPKPGRPRAVGSAAGAPRVSAPRPAAHSELAASELRRFRRELAADLDMPPFTIFNDKTLFNLATALPLDREAFLNVAGTGERHWERFGSKIVEICLLARAAGHLPTPVPRVRRR